MADKTIVMLTSIAGTTWSARPGDDVTVDERVADRLVAAGAAKHKAGRPKKAKVEKAALRTKTEE